MSDCEEFKAVYKKGVIINDFINDPAFYLIMPDHISSYGYTINESIKITFCPFCGKN